MTGDSADRGARVIPRDSVRQLRTRFYRAVTTAEQGGGFVVLLDGRPARTPGKSLLAMPAAELARAVAEEWAAQDNHIDPLTMPLTRLVNTAIDGVRGREAEVRADVVRYAGSDLLCYRADAPDGLVAAQCRHWDPALAWAAHRLGATFKVTQGIMPVAQPQDVLAQVAAAIADREALTLTATHVLTTVYGSAVLALGVLEGAIRPEEAWTAAQVDESWEIAQWGDVPEAAARRKARKADADAAARLLRLTRS